MFTARLLPPDFPVSPPRYSVLIDDLLVGSIMMGTVAHGLPPWQWSITAHAGRRGAETSGRAATLDEAMAAFRAAWPAAEIDLERHRAQMARTAAHAAAWEKASNGT